MMDSGISGSSRHGIGGSYTRGASSTWAKAERNKTRTKMVCIWGKKTKTAKAHVCQKNREIVMVPTDRLSWDTKWQKVPVGNSCAD